MSGNSWEYIQIDNVIKETDKAILVEIDGSQFWIPLSQISSMDLPNCREGDTDFEVAVTKWFAEKEGLI